MAGTRLEVLLELGGTFAGLEGNAADHFPRPVLRRVEVGAFVVALQPGPDVLCQANVGLFGVREAPE